MSLLDKIRNWRTSRATARVMEATAIAGAPVAAYLADSSGIVSPARAEEPPTNPSDCKDPAKCFEYNTSEEVRATAGRGNPLPQPTPPPDTDQEPYIHAGLLLVYRPSTFHSKDGGPLNLTTDTTDMGIGGIVRWSVNASEFLKLLGHAQFTYLKSDSNFSDGASEGLSGSKKELDVALKPLVDVIPGGFDLGLATDIRYVLVIPDISGTAANVIQGDSFPEADKNAHDLEWFVGVHIGGHWDKTNGRTNYLDVRAGWRGKYGLFDHFDITSDGFEAGVRFRQLLMEGIALVLEGSYTLEPKSGIDATYGAKALPFDPVGDCHSGTARAEVQFYRGFGVALKYEGKGNCGFDATTDINTTKREYQGHSFGIEVKGGF